MFNRSRQTQRDFVLIVVLTNMETYRCEVTAYNRQVACRKIIHTQMAKGLSVRSIRDAEEGE
jgi:hypothetical protein